MNNQRLQELLSGSSANNRLEEVFLLAYEAGVCGALLMDFITGLSKEFDEMRESGLEYILAGYSVGQRELAEAEDALIKKVDIKGNDNPNTH